MSFTAEQIPDYIKVDNPKEIKLAFKVDENRYKLVQNYDYINYVLELLKQEKEKNEIQQAVLNDLMMRVTALERK